MFFDSKTKDSIAMTFTRDSSILDTPVLEAVAVDSPRADTAAGVARGPEAAPTNKQRSYTSGPWDISELLPDTSEASISHQLGLIEADIDDFVRRRDTLDPEMDPGDFLVLMREVERLRDDRQPRSDLVDALRPFRNGLRKRLRLDVRHHVVGQPLMSSMVFERNDSVDRLRLDLTSALELEPTQETV